MELSKEAKAARNEYIRNWRRKNPDKMKQYEVNYWERKAGANPLTRETIKKVLIVDAVPTVSAIEVQAIGLHKQGLSLREIGQRLGITHMKVSRILKDCNRV
ncbi:MAG: sigma factor-like helix-turn-helix DNA-binding protein [Ferruginibacter sp.]